MRLEGSFCEVVYSLWAHRPNQTESEQVANLLTANNLHQVLTQISHALHYVESAFDAEYRLVNKGVHPLEPHASLKSRSRDPLAPSHRLVRMVSQSSQHAQMCIGKHNTCRVKRVEIASWF